MCAEPSDYSLGLLSLRRRIDIRSCSECSPSEVPAVLSLALCRDPLDFTNQVRTSRVTLGASDVV
jgi:hypothetical protein